MKNQNKLLFFLFFSIFLQTCQKDDVTSNISTDINTNETDAIFKAENFGNTTTGNFIGFITNEDGLNLENVQITVGNTTTYTDRNGLFIINDADVFENFAFIKAQKDGYIKGSRVVIPKSNGVNRIKIILLKKEVTATVNSGEASEIYKNGARVYFSGDFVRADGSQYNGQVDVVAHYLRPFTSSLYRSMPGGLFAQTTSNEARILETYGMISVSLFSPSGEELNINENNPAIIEFPVNFTQTDTAPDIIELWHFDEDEGYWKEEGQAIREGNKYIAEVSHFTWWNCDLPLDFVNLCFSISPESVSASSVYNVQIKRNTTNQFIFFGNVNSNDGLECGLIPKNEEITLSVYGSAPGCSDLLVYEQILGPYSGDASVDVLFTENLSLTTITGTVTNCAGTPLTNGYVYIDGVNTHSIVDGIIDIGIQHCTDETIIVQIFDFDTLQWTTVNNITLTGELWDIGALSTCENTGGIYNGDVTLSNQQDVIDFGQFNYSTVNGNTIIGTQSSIETSNINSLSPLLGLERVIGNLKIGNNPNLSSLNGLNNLVEVSNSFSIFSNNSLTTLSELSMLADVAIIDLQNNTMLSSLSGLENITNLQGLTLRYLNSLSTLEGLENITNIDFISIYYNDNLVSLLGLDNLTSVSNLRIRGNFDLNEINIDQMDTISMINIENNNTLSDLSILSNLMNVDVINLISNPNLTSLEGINQITTLNTFSIIDSDALIDLSGLTNLTSVSFLSVGLNDSMTSLDGLENLLECNWMLIGEYLETDIIVPASNPNLSDFCALQNLFTNGTFVDGSDTSSPFDGVEIINNAYNPSIQDIIDGNCSQ